MKQFHVFLYIFLVFLVLPLQAQRRELLKMSPTVRSMYFDNHQSSCSMKKARLMNERTATLFIKTSGDITDLLSSNHCISHATFGNVQIVSVPLYRLGSIASDKRIVRMEAGGMAHTTNNRFPALINSEPAYKGLNMPQAYTGSGVVVGIMDIGFDLTCPNFFNNDLSEYRIKAMWDHLSVDTIGSSLPVGRDYVGETALLAYSRSRDAHLSYHGNHTLGTAAGSGFGTDYKGVAYESDICLVSNATSDAIELIDETDYYKYTYATDALGFKYIFDYAESVGKPCVISFSEGSRQDLRGDDILYYESLRAMTGQGKIIVASAGNNNLEPSYIHKPAGVETSGTFLEVWGNSLFLFSQADKHIDVRIVVYGERNDTLTISSEWLCQQPDSLAYDTLLVNGEEYAFAFAAYQSAYDKNKLVVDYSVKGPERLGMDVSSTSISIEFIGIDADVEVYKVKGNFVQKGANPTLNAAVCTHDIFSPGSSPDVICVGATAYSTGYRNMSGVDINNDFGTNGQRARFSSVGPTFDGRIKPDVMAPGVNIISSGGSCYPQANPESPFFESCVEKYEHNGHTYYWKADTGTSMSAPAVGGAIALWLQAKPDLTKEQIMEVFANTCTKTDPALEYPNNECGYGQIDVYHGLLYILGLSKIEGISTTQPSNVNFAVKSHDSFALSFSTPITSDVEVKVYSTSGSLLMRDAVPVGSSDYVVQLPAGISGVVAVQVNGFDKSTTGSTLLRF